MPSRERVAAFIASVVGGDHVRAIADYYHEEASMQENLQSPRADARGRNHAAPERVGAAALGRRSYRGGKVRLRRGVGVDGGRNALAERRG